MQKITEAAARRHANAFASFALHRAGVEVQEVSDALRVWQGRLGEPPEGAALDAKEPRRLVAEALTYRVNNQRRRA